MEMFPGILSRDDFEHLLKTMDSIDKVFENLLKFLEAN
jgi:hypothetical protein